MKKSLLYMLCGAVFLFAGCRKKTEIVAEVVDTTEKKKELAASIFAAVNKRNYEAAQRMITSFIDSYPDDNEVASFKLMLADVSYEQEKYAEAFEAYQHFQEYYPADQRAEYALYKTAHAKFNQAHHVACDSTSTEQALQLCRQYLARADYVRYRGKIEDLARTCEHNLLDKELYVAMSYVGQQRFASARYRLQYIAEKFDLSEYGKDHLLLCKAKLAKAENNEHELVQIVDDLHAAYPLSQFTAMADRLVGKKRLQA